MTTLVVLPGMDGTGLLLDAFVSALGSGFSVKIIRYPANEPLTYPALEALARAALPEQGPFFILGESFSGPIAVSLASARPPNLEGLILCCSFVRTPRPALSWLKPFVRVMPLKGAPMAALSYFLLGGTSSNPLRSMFSEALARVSPGVLRARLRAVLAVDVSAKLAALDLPILYLRATRDRVVPRGASELVSRLHPRTRMAEIDAPHFLLQTEPAEAARAVKNFVNEVMNRNA